MTRRDEAAGPSFVRRYWKPVALAAAFILSLWAMTPLVVRWWIGADGHAPTERGVFGDQFGMTNALFSGLAFLALIVTLILQHEELKDTRKVMEEQRDEFKQQVAAIRKQNFEATFFQMLRLQDQIRGSISIGSHKRSDRADQRGETSAHIRCERVETHAAKLPLSRTH